MRQVFNEIAKLVKLFKEHESNKGYHVVQVHRIMNEYFPAGENIAEIDFIFNESSNKKLVFTCIYHHEADNSMTAHNVVVTPATLDYNPCFNIKVTGRDKNGVKDIIKKTFEFSLALPVDPKTLYIKP